MFTKERDIIPFIESYWESLTTMSRRVIQSSNFTTSIHKSLLNNPQIFIYETDEGTGENVFGLKNRNLLHIKPNYEQQQIKDALNCK